MIAGIELGGTKTVVAIGDPAAATIDETRFATTSPRETLSRACEWLRDRGTPGRIGVATFGPVGLVPGSTHHGKLLHTPKPGWSGFPVTGTLHAEFPGAAIVIDTDVNAAALAEARLGAAAGLQDLAYITVGTGIGAGILVGGRMLHGSLHPEFGHLKVPRHANDSLPGVCPFHGDCLEGLASGPAIAARHGMPAAELPPDHPGWDIVAWYLAHGILALAAIVAPARVILGGGIAQAPGLHQRVDSLLRHIASNYFSFLAGQPFVVKPALEQQAGIRGALILASSGKPGP